MNAKQLVFAAALLFSAGPLHATQSEDPLNSVMWDDIRETFFSSGPITFDPRIRFMLPDAAEDQFQVPVTVDARAINDVVEIVLIADMNPIAKVLTYRPFKAEPFLGVRIKVAQKTAVRAGVRLKDGSWHLAGAVVDAAGGGCSTPAAAHGAANWMARLGNMKANLRSVAGHNRLSVNMMHPMDTGFADGVPAFFISEMTVMQDGKALAEFELFEPVSENPTFTLMPRLEGADRPVIVSARDTEGNNYGYLVSTTAREGQ